MAWEQTFKSVYERSVIVIFYLFCGLAFPRFQASLQKSRCGSPKRLALLDFSYATPEIIEKSCALTFFNLFKRIKFTPLKWLNSHAFKFL